MNFDMLRPFDLEAAKRGEKLISVIACREDEYILVADAGPDGCHAIRDLAAGNIWTNIAENLRMAPLAWVEDKPVYPGDTLYWNNESNTPGLRFVVGSRMVPNTPYDVIAGDSYDGDVLSYRSVNGHSGMRPENLSWTPPKVKKQGWINVYRDNSPGLFRGIATIMWNSKEDAEAQALAGRIACVPVEWEE